MWRFSMFVVLFVAVTVQAQTSGNRENETLCTLRVEVAFADKGVPAQGLRVELLQGLVGGTPYQVGLTNSSGWTEFESLPPGDYQAVVSGAGIETTNSGDIHIENGKVFQDQFVVVRRRIENASAENSVDVHDLDVPQKTKDERPRGDAEMRHRNW